MDLTSTMQRFVREFIFPSVIVNVDSVANIVSLCNLCSPIQIITLQTLLTILNTTKSTEITGVIKTLSPDTQDTLMKYLYKGMGMPGWGDISGSVLLGWHEKVGHSFLVHLGRMHECSLSLTAFYQS